MNFKKIFLLIFSFLFLHFSVNADVLLPNLISDGMVLQRDAKVNVWGWADPNEKVTVSIDGKMYSTKTDASGNWLLKLKKHKAGGPYTMLIEGKNKIEIKNIVFWRCVALLGTVEHGIAHAAGKTALRSRNSQSFESDDSLF